MAAPVEIVQGTTRALVVKTIRDRLGALLDPTGWAVLAVVRRGPRDDLTLAAWSTTPTGTQGLAEVGNPEPDPGETVEAGEKWIYLRVAPAMSRAWTWDVGVLHVHITEPIPPYREEQVVDQQLVLKRTNVYA